MSLHHLSWALEQEARSPLHKLVLVLAASRCGDDGRIPDARDAERACCSLKEYCDALNDLIADGRLAGEGPLRLAAPEPVYERKMVPWGPTPAFRKRILDRDGNACVSCGATEKLVIDHIIPRSRGGRNDDKNLQVLCAPCNNSKGRKIPGEWKGRPR
jgi:hypothetical protein